MKREILVLLLFSSPLHAAVIPRADICDGQRTYPTLSASQDNYNIITAKVGVIESACVIQWSSSAPVNITGIGWQSLRAIRYVINDGANSITLKNESASSTDKYRFSMGADLVLAAKSAVILFYDWPAQRWKLLSSMSVGGGAAAWGGITGTLSTQTDLQTALDGKEASGTFSGIGACGASTWASTLNDTAAPTCTQPTFTDVSGSVTDAQVPNTITVDLATAATALQNNPSDCAANAYAQTIAASGNLTCKQVAYSEITSPPAIPTDLSAEPFVTSAATANLSAERVVTAGTNTTVDVGTVGQIKINLSGTVAQTLGGTGAGALTCAGGDFLTSNGTVQSCATPAGGSGLSQSQVLTRQTVGF